MINNYLLDKLEVETDAFIQRILQDFNDFWNARPATQVLPPLEVLDASNQQYGQPASGQFGQPELFDETP